MINDNNTVRKLEDYPDVLTIKNVQDIMGIGRNGAYKLINEQGLKCPGLGRIIRVSKQCLIDYLSSCEYNNTDSHTVCRDKDGER